MRILINSILNNRIVQHVTFWTVSFYVLLTIFTSSSDFLKIDFIYTGIFLFTILLMVYTNILYLVPVFLSRKRIFIYGILITILLLVFSFINQMLFDEWVDHILPGYYFISYYSFGDLLKFFLTFYLVSTLLKLSKEWFLLSEVKQKLIATEKAKTEVELKSLKSQINPHFLFNSLNVIHSLALNNSKSTSDAIIQLSDILRYTIYDSNLTEVKISSEMKLISEFIKLQKHRISPEAKIEFNKKIDDSDFTIAPLLLLPLVENSFKHGIKGDIKNTFITINVDCNSKGLCFKIKNNKGVEIEDNNRNSSGFGIPNLKERLELIYPKNYSLKIENEKSHFEVKLIINK